MNPGENNSASLREVYKRIQDVDDKYDKKIGDLDSKYDRKNTSVVEQFTKVTEKIGQFTRPVAEMAVQVEANKDAVKDATEEMKAFKNKIFWTMVAIIGWLIGSFLLGG